ncbi:MAG: helix-turn-helix domain-containing protein [Nitrosopumilus sp.]|nr:helix-turn-helix domain-containing protein [Nitrosopumilus sp.]MBL7018388.1 helix-turn-helix domain-containing protein [Nitrosopumilus sp.]
MATVEIQQSIDREYGDVYCSMQTVLKKFGLTPNELKVYNHLIENGPKRANEIGKDLDIYRTETYRLLNSLQTKGMINAIFDKPTKFVGINYDRALDLLINNQIENLNELRSMRDSLLKSEIIV